MKSSKDIVLQKALSLVKQHRKRFYRNIWTHWDKRDIVSNPNHALHNHLETRMDFVSNPEWVCELAMVGNALLRLGLGVSHPSMELLIKVHKKYMPRFIKYYLQPMVLRNGGVFPHMDKTDALKELLARGWVHEDGMLFHNPKNVYLKCNIAPLVWPEEYYHHQDAIVQNDRVGIPGYTGTKLPKSK